MTDSVYYGLDQIPDWFFYFLIALLLILAWIRIVYTKFLTEFLAAPINYQLSLRIHREAGIVRKRVGYTLNLIYLISGGLYLFLLCNFFGFYPYGFEGKELLLFCGGILLALIVIRTGLMGITAIIFNQRALFYELAHHFYLYNKALGLILIPFLLLIPYTEEYIQQLFVYMSITVAGLVYIIRLIRIIIFIFRNVVLLFYLFLYLCILEILPVLVIIRLIMSLEQGS